MRHWEKLCWNQGEEQPLFLSSGNKDSSGLRYWIQLHHFQLFVIVWLHHNSAYNHKLNVGLEGNDTFP